MVFEEFFVEKYLFRTPALSRLNERLVRLDKMYVREAYLDAAMRASNIEYKSKVPKAFPLLDRISMAILIIMGP